MVKIKYILGILIATTLILGNGSTPLVMAQALPGSDLNLLSSDDQAIVLELTVADFQVETVEQAGQTYQRLIIPGTVQTNTPGEPQVPTRGTLVGLPSTEKVSVQILDADYETWSGYRLYPAPGLQVRGDNVDDLPADGVQPIFVLNQELYATDAFYPGRPVEIGHSGYLRDQAVAPVQFYPVQYNPVTSEIRLYRRIRARITWGIRLPLAAAEPRIASPAYENLLQKTLLNYDALERPPVLDEAPPMEPPPITPTDASDALKIGVTEDGLYQLIPSDLSDAGFDLTGLDPDTIKISNQGTEIRIFVHDDGDNIFDDPSDYLLFYGTAITDIYTTQNVYWLTAGGDPGQRMTERDGTPSGGTVPDHFPVTLHAEEDTHYWQTMPNGEGQDHWFWGSRLIASAPERWRDYTLTVNNIYSTTATVRVRLKGYTAPEHWSKIHLNGTQIDDQTWSGQIIYNHEATVSNLQNGSNTVGVEAVEIGLMNQFYVNWIEIDYRDTYKAENDELLFGAPSADTFQFEVEDFTTHTITNPIQVFDVTDPANVAVISNTNVVDEGDSYTLQFEDSAQLDTRYLALTPGQRKSPASIELDQPSSWQSTSRGADYIIITHEDFYTKTLTLETHRETTPGLRVVTAKVEDIYDEFNYGIFNPQAIRDFLSYAYDNWIAPAPAYVLLVGDATYDYKDNLGEGMVNYVPSQLVHTDAFGETASDNWFVLVSGPDILPDMFIGRLTAQTASEAQDMVDKIIHYDQNPPDDSWNTEGLLVADDRDLAFEDTCELIADLLPHYYTANKVYTEYYPEPPDGDPKSDITNYINDGSILVNYAGHGSADSWGLWGHPHHIHNIYHRNNVHNDLQNTHKLPVVTLATCLNGHFVGTTVSMAEEFLRRPDKGALAVWADTSMGYPSGHKALMGSFYEAIFQDDVYALGAVTTRAKIENSFWDEMVKTYVLFGDPATQLGIPTNYPYVESTTPADGATGVPVDQDIQIVFSKPMSPTTVYLSGPGTTGLVFTPTWSENDTVVDYAHTPDFDYGETLVFTINGQDNLGNPLGTGPVPSTWSFSTPTAPDDVDISGPTTGVVQEDYDFTATVSPITATQPITYEWEATDQSPVTHTGGDLDDTVTFNWDSPGLKIITVTASNAVGSATDAHEVTINYAPPSSVDIAGPTAGITQTIYAFTATVSPGTTTQPITYEWEATDQSLVTHPGGDLDDTVNFTWNVTGTKTITVTATNVAGTVTDIHEITIDDTQASETLSVYLPLVIKND